MVQEGWAGLNTLQSVQFLTQEEVLLLQALLVLMNKHTLQFPSFWHW